MADKALKAQGRPVHRSGTKNESMTILSHRATNFVKEGHNFAYQFRKSFHTSKSVKTFKIFKNLSTFPIIFRKFKFSLIENFQRIANT